MLSGHLENVTDWLEAGEFCTRRQLLALRVVDVSFFCRISMPSELDGILSEMQLGAILVIKVGW